MNARVPTATTPASFDILKAESFVRGESMLAVVVDQPVAVVCERLERIAAETGHLVLGRHDVAALLRGPTRAPQPRSALLVYDIGRPGLMEQVLAADPAMAHALPSRVVVHDAHGVTTVTTPRPSMTWLELSHEPQIARLAQLLERGLQRLLRGLQ